MNFTFPLRHRSDRPTSRPERRTRTFDDAHAVTRKALERWENEGGKVPELAAIKESTDPPPGIR
jgi:hypothetical protein